MKKPAITVLFCAAAVIILCGRLETSDEGKDMRSAVIGMVPASACVAFGKRVAAELESALDGRCELLLLYARRNGNRPPSEEVCREWLTEWRLSDAAFHADIDHAFSMMWFELDDDASNLGELLSAIPRVIPCGEAELKAELRNEFCILTSPPSADILQYEPLTWMTGQEQYRFLLLRAYFSAKLHTAFARYMKEVCHVREGMIACLRPHPKPCETPLVEKAPSLEEIEQVLDFFRDFPTESCGGSPR